VDETGGLRRLAKHAIGTAAISPVGLGVAGARPLRTAAGSAAKPKRPRRSHARQPDGHLSDHGEDVRGRAALRCFVNAGKVPVPRTAGSLLLTRRAVTDDGQLPGEDTPWVV